MNKALFWIAAAAMAVATILGGAGYARAIVMWPLLLTPYACLIAHVAWERKRGL